MIFLKEERLLYGELERGECNKIGVIFKCLHEQYHVISDVAVAGSFNCESNTSRVKLNPIQTSDVYQTFALRVYWLRPLGSIKYVRIDIISTDLVDLRIYLECSI